MAYTVDVATRVEDYIEQFEGLSDLARAGIMANLLARLGSDGDRYRNDSSKRIAPESFLFWLTLNIFDATMGKLHHFRFLVSDEHTVTGVLRVLFADTGGPKKAKPHP